MNRTTKSTGPGRVKSAVLNWLGVPLGLSDGSFWSSHHGHRSTSGENVTPETALKIAAVWACVGLLSETIASLPLDVFRRVPGTSPVEDSKHPLYELIHNQPNADMTAMDFWQSVMVSLLLRGVAYGEKVPGSSGAIIALDFLIPDRMERARKQDGSYRYRYTELDGTKRDIPEDRIFYVRGLSLDGINHLSPLHFGADTFGAAMAADRSAASTFKNGLLPTVGFKLSQFLKPDQRKQFRDNFAKEVGGAMNSGKPFLMEGGMEASMLGIKPSDAQLLESRAFSVEEVCRRYRVPPFMIGHTQKSTSWGTGIEQQMIGFLTFALRPWLKRIEQAIRKYLLKPEERANYFAKFDVKALLRTDSAARAEYLSTMTQNGIMTRAEAREEEGLPFIPGSDKLTAQVNLAPLDTLGTAAKGTGDTE